MFDQQTADLIRENERLREFIRMEVRKAEMQAAVMRNPVRTGGWEGAEKVAMAFERAAIRHREILNK